MRGLWKVYCSLLALVILFQIGLGWQMTRLDFYHRWYHAAPSLHKSMGIIILLMTLIRVAVRLKEGLPPARDLLRSLRFNVFGLQHTVLYAFLLTLALTGYLFATSKGDAIPFFGLFEVPSLFKTGKLFRETADKIHFLLAYSLAGLIVIHSVQMFKRWRKMKVHTR